MLSGILGVLLNFWFITPVFILIIFGFLLNRRQVYAILSIIAYFAILSVVGHFNIITFVLNYPITTMATLVAYFSCGTLWSFFKWGRFTSKSRENYDNFKNKFLERHEIKDGIIPHDLKQKWLQEVTDYVHDLPLDSRNYQRHEHNRNLTGSEIQNILTPKASKFKRKIIFWMTYWPFSLIHSVFNDMLRFIWSEIYSTFANIFQKISDRKFRDIDTDFN